MYVVFVCILITVFHSMQYFYHFRIVLFSYSYEQGYCSYRVSRPLPLAFAGICFLRSQWCWYTSRRGTPDLLSWPEVWPPGACWIEACRLVGSRSSCWGRRKRIGRCFSLLASGAWRNHSPWCCRICLLHWYDQVTRRSAGSWQTYCQS